MKCHSVALTPVSDSCRGLADVYQLAHRARSGILLKPARPYVYIDQPSSLLVGMKPDPSPSHQITTSFLSFSYHFLICYRHTLSNPFHTLCLSYSASTFSGRLQTFIQSPFPFPSPHPKKKRATFISLHLIQQSYNGSRWIQLKRAISLKFPYMITLLQRIFQSLVQTITNRHTPPEPAAPFQSTQHHHHFFFLPSNFSLMGRGGYNGPIPEGRGGYN